MWGTSIPWKVRDPGFVSWLCCQMGNYFSRTPPVECTVATVHPQVQRIHQDNQPMSWFLFQKRGKWKFLDDNLPNFKNCAAKMTSGAICVCPKKADFCWKFAKKKTTQSRQILLRYLKRTCICSICERLGGWEKFQKSSYQIYMVLKKMVLNPMVESVKKNIN